MDATRNLLVRQTIVGEPEPRNDERSEAARGGGSPAIVRETSAAPPNSEVTAHRARRRFTTHYKLEILQKADACTRPGQLGALLRKEGLYSSHLVTWRRQREDGLTPKKRGRKTTRVDPQLKKLEQENRRLLSRLQKAEALLAFQKQVSELLQIPLKPFVSDEDD
jgi:transposase-like protein